MEKTILVVGSGDPDNYESDIVQFGEMDSVIVKDIDVTSGRKLRGYDADLIVLTAELDQSVRNNVIAPMEALGGEVIELY